MKPNPGGTLKPSEIVGRDGIVADLVRTLDQQSVVITAERRTGKTHVLEKLLHAKPANWVIIKRDISPIRSASEFTQRLLHDLYPHFPATTNFVKWVGDMVTNLGGTKIGSVTLPNFSAQNWKQSIEKAVEQLDQLADVERVVFLWDELPWMLEYLVNTDPAEAMELLDTLRSLRQTRPDKLRMVFTGSLGLHHVVRRLKAKGYNGTPTNDMQQLEVEPLALADASNLAKQLCLGVGLKTPGTPEFFEELAVAVDCMPYYIHHVVAALNRNTSDAGAQSAELDTQLVESVITKSIHSANDPWNLQHYEERTADYYGNDRDASLTLLDVVANSPEPLTLADVIKRAKPAHPGQSDQSWRELCRLLEQDHYFVRTSTGAVTFKFTVVKRWWVWHRTHASLTGMGTSKP